MTLPTKRHITKEEKKKKEGRKKKKVNNDGQTRNGMGSGQKNRPDANRELWPMHVANSAH